VRFFQSAQKNLKTLERIENALSMPKIMLGFQDCGVVVAKLDFGRVGGGVAKPSKRLRFSSKINELSIRTSDTEKLIELTCEQLTIKISLSLLGFYEQYSTAPDVPKPLVAEKILLHQPGQGSGGITLSFLLACIIATERPPLPC
jgi:hypothetical protein